MKNKITLFSLFVLFQAHAQNQWVDISPPGMSAYNLMDIYAKGDKIICVGDNPTGTLYSAVSITQDNGASWQTKTANYVNMFTKTIAFSDDNTGYIGGYAYLGGVFKSATLKSTTGGLTWGPIVTHSLEGIESITFTDAMNGYAAGYNTFLYTGSFYRTSNGGNTWNVIYTNNSDAFEDVWMAPDDMIGYATDFYPNLFRTTDGGISWSKITNVPGSLGGFHFWNGTDGVVCTINGKIYRTTNGGASWTPTNNGGNTRGLSDIEFLDANFGFCIGDQGTILESADGGNTWTKTTIPGGPEFTRVEFHDSKAYALGTSGVVYQYERSTVSLPQYSKNAEITCSPNPAKQQVTVTSKDIQAESISVYNALGEEVLTQEVNTKQATLDVSALEPALYFVHLKDGAGHSFVRKIVKE